ncbi:MAG: SynChlorMet cassette radical SAM/SPASM protein ScmE [Desulfobacteraceae bacterium]|nr:MAG: SynChlorMet cassette radical SAM/SPASM protein ScmE [Desulfobacteraceae bacterium]
MKTPRTVDIAITARCNLRCAYCSHFSAPGDTEDLETEEWLRFFRELNRCAVMDVILQGGEPFFRKDLRRLLEGIVENRMRFSILTNGTLVRSDLARFIAGTGRCNGVQVSLDGSLAETHDSFRGKGAFHDALRGIEIFKAAGVPATVRVTVHKKNVDQLESIAALLLDEIGLSGFSTNAAGFMGLCRSNSEHVQLSANDRTLAMKTLTMLEERYGGRITASAGPLAEAKIWTRMVVGSSLDHTEETSGGFLSACSGPFDTIGVRSDGVMVPCIQLGHIELGRINRDDLQSVWLDHPQLHRLRRRRLIPLSSFEFCSGCRFIDHCTGNCPALAFTLTGKENHPSPDACLKRFLEEGGILPNQRSEVRGQKLDEPRTRNPQRATRNP